jgi:hypothetical protein
MTKTERERALATDDLKDSRQQRFDAGFKAGSKAGSAAERARIKAVLEQSFPGQEELVEQLAFDGKTTGPQAALLVLAAERKKRGIAADDLRLDGPRSLSPVPIQNPTGAMKIADATMSAEQVEVIANEEWKADPQLAHEFTSQAAYVAFRKMEAAGRIRVINRRRVN